MQRSHPTAIPERMLATVLSRSGGVASLAPDTFATPTPAADEVLVRVATVGLNRRDLDIIDGSAHTEGVQLPLILGLDPAGVVAEVGRKVTALAPGERVVVMPSISCATCVDCRAGRDDACTHIRTIGVDRPGGMAEYVAVPARNVARIPGGIGFAEASAIAMSNAIALTLLRKVSADAGEAVLVSGASGAVGSAVVQLARMRKARVVAVVGGEHGAQWLRALPRDVAPELVIDRSRGADVGALVRERFPDGVGVYVETTSDPDGWREALRSLRAGGRIAVVGAHAGPIVELDNEWLYRRRVTIHGCWGSTLAAFHEVLRLAGEGRIAPNIDSIQPMSNVVAAYQRLIDHKNEGKVILRVADEVD
jgi:D-arabinose 1-dehydrogenase-like Zn-dependent alcohol dehydrogenase